MNYNGKNHNLIFEKKAFWECLFYLEQLSEDVTIDSIIEDLETSEADIQTALNYLNILNQNYEIYEKDYVKYLKVPENKELVNISFTPAEWIALQLHFPLMEEYSHHTFHHKIRFELSKIEQEYNHLDARDSLSELNLIADDSSLKSTGLQLESANLLTIRSAINKKCLLSLVSNKGDSINLFPRKLVSINGALNIIGEDDQDRCLVNICLHHIKSINIERDLHFTPSTSNHDVDDFIDAIRSVDDSEVRVVIKIKNKLIDFKEPKFQHIKNPYIISNHDGDFIWAGSLEINTDILDWINTYHNDVEILGPKKLKIDYKNYLKKLNQKAS